MKFLNIRTALIVALFAGSASAFIYYSRKTPPPNLDAPTAADFTLQDLEGKTHRLYDMNDKKAVVIIGHGLSCPIIQKFMIRLHEIYRKYEPEGIAFLLLNPNTEDDLESLKKEAQEYDIKIPILRDPTQAVAKAFGFTRTAETLIITPSNWKILFHGAISDRLDYGVDKLEAQNEYLTLALDEILNSGFTTVTPQPAKGCAYTYVQN
jgi:peroxiredoxin